MIFKLLTYWFFGEKTSKNALGCCGIIIVGFLLGIDQEKGLGKYMSQKYIFNKFDIDFY